MHNTMEDLPMKHPEESLQSEIGEGDIIDVDLEVEVDNEEEEKLEIIHYSDYSEYEDDEIAGEREPTPEPKPPVIITPLDDAFPEKLLGEIFRYVYPDRLDNVCKTSERWANIVDQYTGRVLVVKDGKDYIVDYESLFDKFSIKGNFWMSLARDKPLILEDEKDCQESSCPKPTADDDMEETAFPVIRHPDSVRKIGFVGLHSSDLLNKVLYSCTNVTGLYLHFSVFVTLNDGLKQDWDVSSICPFIKELVIDCCGTGIADTDQAFNYKNAYCAVYLFISSPMFYLLEKFIFAVPYVELWEGPLVFALCGFLGRHSDTLRCFSFNQKYELYDDEYKESGRESTSEDEEVAVTGTDSEKAGDKGEGDCPKKKKSLSLYDGLPPDDASYLGLKQLAVNMRELRKLSLEEFHIVLACAQESSPLWKNLLIQQTGFKKLIFVGDKIPLPYKTIEANFATLVTARLDVRDVVDVDCFKNCKSLKHLTLRGKQDNLECSDEDEDDDGHQKFPSYTPPVQLKNARSLPHCLQCVEIINLRTDRDDAAFLSVVLPYLRDLTLINLGSDGRLGLRLSHLALFWELHRLDHFCIKSSLNMMSYSELDNDTRYPLNLLGCVIQSNSFAAASRFCLEVWKNKEGHYTTCKRENYPMDDDDIDVFQIPNRNQELLNEKDEESESEEEEEEEEESGSGSEETAEESADEEWEDCDDGDGSNVEGENEESGSD